MVIVMYPQHRAGTPDFTMQKQRHRNEVSEAGVSVITVHQVTTSATCATSSKQLPIIMNRQITLTLGSCLLAAVNL